jgi:hypothetical protein
MATEAPLDGNDATASTPPTDIVNAAQWASAINDADQGAFSGEDYVVSSTASKPSEKNRDAAAQSSTDVTDAQQAKAQSKPAPRIKRSTLVKRRIVTSVPVEIPPPNVQAGGSGTAFGPGFGLCCVQKLCYWRPRHVSSPGHRARRVFFFSACGTLPSNIIKRLWHLTVKHY